MKNQSSKISCYSPFNGCSAKVARSKGRVSRSNCSHDYIAEAGQIVAMTIRDSIACTSKTFTAPMMSHTECLTSLKL